MVPKNVPYHVYMHVKMYSIYIYILYILFMYGIYCIHIIQLCIIYVYIYIFTQSIRTGYSYICVIYKCINILQTQYTYTRIHYDMNDSRIKSWTFPLTRHSLRILFVGNSKADPRKTQKLIPQD